MRSGILPSWGMVYLSVNRKLFENGNYDLNKRNNQGFTMLQQCASLGRMQSCKFLLDNGADIRLPGPMGSHDAIRICEMRFDYYEVEKHRQKIKSNPYEECLEYLEEYSEKLELEKQ